MTIMEGGGTFIIVVVVILIVWVSVLSVFLFRALKHYHMLTAGTDRQTLQSGLVALIADVRKHKELTEKLHEHVQQLQTNGEYVIQKTSLLRFNPFADSGGEQSFTVALLDNRNNGILITSLHGRNGNRWYAKMVKKGKGVEIELSKEEEEAIEKAKPLI